jgi:ribosomal protein L34
MKIKTRNSSSKHKKKTGFRTRQKTAGVRKVNKRQRARAAGRR